MTAPLDQRIVETLTQPCTSSDVAAVLADAQEHFAGLEARAEAADNESLSPLLSMVDAAEKRRIASELRFESDRMDASISALKTRGAELRDAEQAEALAELRAAAIEERDALAADIAREYPGIVKALTTLAKRIADNDARCLDVGVSASAEAIGRSVPEGFYHNGAEIMRIQRAVLPMPDGVWPAWSFTGSGMVWRGLNL